MSQPRPLRLTNRVFKHRVRYCLEPNLDRIRPRRYWSPADLDIAQDLWGNPDNTVESIAAGLGRTVAAIRTQAGLRGWGPRPRR